MQQIIPQSIGSDDFRTPKSLGDYVWIWGLPMAPFTRRQALERIEELVARRNPAYFITANLHYAMLTCKSPALQKVNSNADFILADGMPMVWASRREQLCLPERVPGSDLLFWICERAAAKGWRLYFLGAGPGIAALAADQLRRHYPGLQVVGTESPPFRPWTPTEEGELFQRIQESKPDILFVAFGQPKGEFWIAENHRELGVPVSVQVGAAIDFAAGRVRRAPRWIQRTGMEWLYRIAQEPRRLFLRYVDNISFLFAMLFGSKGRRDRRHNKRRFQNPKK